MITTRTPLRISFFGGGTDYPQWFEKHDGAVLGGAIAHYCYVMLHNGKSWFTFDLPNKSGLGSSSAYTVGLLKAVNPRLNPDTLARLATTWEFDKMGGNVGAQDQWLCAHGGLRHLRFNGHGVRDVVLDRQVAEDLAPYLMLFDTHQYRRAGDVVARQLADMGQNEQVLTEMAAMVPSAIAAVEGGNWHALGEMLNESWLMKRQLSDIVTTPDIDAIYTAAREAGAWGGKLLGAGGGGFMAFCVAPERQDPVRDALEGLTEAKVKFDYEGSKVLYADCPD